MSFQDIFTTGIGAVRDVLVARETNDPTPNSRGANNVTAPVGTPALGSLGAAVGGAGPVLALAAVALIVYLLVRR